MATKPSSYSRPSPATSDSWRGGLGLTSAENRIFICSSQRSPQSRGPEGRTSVPGRGGRNPKTQRPGPRPPRFAHAGPGLAPSRHGSPGSAPLAGPRPLRPAAATPDVSEARARRAGGRTGGRGEGRGLAQPRPLPPPPAGGGLRAGLPAPIPLTLFCAFVLVHTSRWSRTESFPSVPRAGAHLARRRGPRWRRRRRRVRARGQPIAAQRC